MKRNLSFDCLETKKLAADLPITPGPIAPTPPIGMPAPVIAPPVIVAPPIVSPPLLPPPAPIGMPGNPPTYIDPYKYYFDWTKCPTSPWDWDGTWLYPPDPNGGMIPVPPPPIVPLYPLN